LCGLPIPQARQRRSPVRDRSRVVRARLQLAELFGNKRPLGVILGGNVTLFGAPPYLVGAVRGGSARIGAETDSIGSDSEGTHCECGRPLADNRCPHEDRCDVCIDYRPAQSPFNPPPEVDTYLVSNSNSPSISLPSIPIARRRFAYAT